jgi:hypothetical protein
MAAEQEEFPKQSEERLEGQERPFFDLTDLNVSQLRQAILYNSNLDAHQRIVAATGIIFSRYQEILRAEPSKMPTAAELEEYSSLATYLYQKRGDRDNDYILELLNELEEELGAVSPTVIARTAERMLPFHDAPKIVTIVTQLWLLDVYHQQERMPSTFDAAKQFCLTHKPLRRAGFRTKS